MTNRVIRILMRREDMSEADALKMVRDSYECMNCADNPENIEEMLHSELGLEPDFVFDIIDLAREKGW